MTATPSSMPEKSRLRLFFEWMLILVLLLGSGAFIKVHGTFDALDQVTYDGLMWQMEQPADERIVLVEIDDVSLNQLGRWPWSREVHAQFLDVIKPAHPKGVLMDILFVEPSNPKADNAMAQSAKNLSKWVLPALLTSANGNILDLGHPEDGIQLQMPIQPLLQHAQVGLATAAPDSDNTVRRIYMGYDLQGQVLPTMSALLLDGREASRVDQVLIPYTGGMNHYERVSYADVLNGTVPASRFQDRYVFVGATAVGLGDLHKTPFGIMSGVEIHANVFDGLLNQRSLSMLESKKMVMLYTLLPLLLLMLGFLFINETWHFYWLLAWVGMWLGLCAYLLTWQHLWASPVTTILLLVVAYILWSWRRIAAMMRYFEGQLRGIQIQLPDSNIEVEQRNNAHTLQGVIEHIDRLQSAQQQIQVQNRELIDYLSHDLRTPQVSILSAIAMHKSNPEQMPHDVLFAQITENAQDTLQYARDLVELNHAQTGDLVYEEHQIQYLIDYAVERINVQAQEKRIRINVLRHNDLAAWVLVDGELIERAIINLISNAIRYSPEHSTVRIQLQYDEISQPHWISLLITDQGVGMSASLQQALLQGLHEKKMPSQQAAPDAGGSMGIGWRMVQSIVRRHQGRLQIKSDLGQGCTVTMSLPLID